MRSRYVYDMYYIYHRISREVYDYCIEQKLVDAALIAKWKKVRAKRAPVWVLLRCVQQTDDALLLRFVISALCSLATRSCAPHT